MNWESLDWEVLDRLRETFLSDAKATGPYWHTITDLECYDFTFGERIGWKWDAVLRELRQRGWSPGGGPDLTAADEPGRTTCGERSRTILDWGCGSGIAGRRVLEFFGTENFDRLLVHDRSKLAMDFAEHHGRKQFPTVGVGRPDTRYLRSGEPIDVLVISHVLNELDDVTQAELGDLCARAQCILWVEPGTHEVSRALGAWRERLRAGMTVVAPCPHQAACGILAAGNERHWCHFFATPPAGVHADSGWVKFGRRAGIDLRSLPYSFLVLDRRPVTAVCDRRDDGNGADGGQKPPLRLSRIIGRPGFHKGYARIFSCDERGVHDLMLQKRDAPELFKRLQQGTGPGLHRWSHENGRITPLADGRELG